MPTILTLVEFHRITLNPCRKILLFSRTEIISKGQPFVYAHVHVDRIKCVYICKHLNSTVPVIDDNDCVFTPSFTIDLLNFGQIT